MFGRDGQRQGHSAALAILLARATLGIQQHIGRRNGITLGLQPVGPGVWVGAHHGHRPDPRQGAFVALQNGVIGGKLAGIIGGVCIAKQHRVITLPAQGQGPVIMPSIQWCAVGASPMVLQVHARMQAGA